MLHWDYKYVLFEGDTGNVMFFWKVFSQCVFVNEHITRRQKQMLSFDCIKRMFLSDDNVDAIIRLDDNFIVLDDTD